MDAIHRLNRNMPWPSNYVGIPYKRFGRSKEGVDCWGLCWLIFRDRLGIKLNKYGTIDPDEAEAVVHAIADGRKDRIWEKVALENAKEFDFVIMRAVVSIKGVLHSLPVHIGLMVDGKTIIHVQEEGTVILQKVEALKHRIVEVVRHKEIS